MPNTLMHVSSICLHEPTQFYGTKCTETVSGTVAQNLHPRFWLINTEVVLSPYEDPHCPVTVRAVLAHTAVSAKSGPSFETGCVGGCVARGYTCRVT